MKVFILIILAGLIFSCENTTIPTDAAALLNNIEWLENSSPFGSATIRIRDKQVIYFDPGALNITDETPKADLILITHGHAEHFSVGNVRQLVKDDTQIVTLAELKLVLEERIKDQNLHINAVKVGDKIKINGIEIEAVPSYNTGERPLHPKESGLLGFIVNYRGVCLYFSGSTSFIPEMTDIKNIDIAFISVGVEYTLSGPEAIQTIGMIKPKYVIPVHWMELQEKEIEYLKANCPSATELRVLTLVRP
jgi:L-ascorbate metabolism protein UlaG (beta-lactamase superfamily)